MLTLKTWALICGIVLCCLGIKCLPVGFGANPKRDLNIFNNYADGGAFAHTGLVLICAGLLIISLSLVFSSLARAIRRFIIGRRKGV